MSSSVLGLYCLTVLIWGSTWIAITFQLGTVAPLASVIYRFTLASVLLFIWCWFRKIPLTLTAKEHGLVFLQGSFLFGFNYWLMYSASQYLTSGLVAVIFSLIVFFNIFNARLLLRSSLQINVLIGAGLGLVGVVLLFSQEFTDFNLGSDIAIGAGFALLATYVASLGNIVATRNSHNKRSVMTVNAWGMLYGTLVVIVLALILNVEFNFEFTPAYISSLIYLSIFGSIITFAAYLKLLSMIGPDKAGYVGMLVPVVALILSSIFEDYSWTLPAVLGLCLILAGNWLVMGKRSS